MEKNSVWALVTCGKTPTTVTWRARLKIYCLLLLRNKDQMHNNPQASSCLCRQRIRHERRSKKIWRGQNAWFQANNTILFRIPPLQAQNDYMFRKFWSGHSTRGPLATMPVGPRVHLSGPACMVSCICPEVRLPLDQHVLCSDCCKKMYHVQASESSLILYCIATRYLWCLRPKLHICVACCLDSQMQLLCS